MSGNEIAGVHVYEGTVKPEWIDFNQHMNVAYYVLAFDLGVDALWTRFGITEEYIRESRGSTFAVENHVAWHQELHEGDPYFVTSQVLGYDAKRIHQFQRMYHAEKRYLAATAEWLNLHIDLDERRVAPWPDHILDHIAEFANAQSGQSRPAEAGQTISIPKPLYVLE